MALAPNIEPKRAAGGHYLATLDGWRAVAIILVLLDHDKIYRFAGFSSAWLHKNGGMGVDLFFALSGLLICTRLLTEESETGVISLRKFYLRRFFRIQPAALAYLGTLTLLMLCGVLDRAFGGVLAAFLLVRNYFPLHSFAIDWYSAHFWSLSVEEHFYLILPPALILFRNHRLKFLFGLAIVLRLWEAVVHRHTSLEFGWDPQFHTDVALPGILLAAAGAVLLTNPKILEWSKKWLRPYIIVPLTLATCYAVTLSFNPLLEISRVCLLPILIVSTMLHPKAFISKFLDFAPIRFLGRISYSIYLWQMLFFVSRTPVPAPHSFILNSIQESWLRYPITGIVVLASYYLIEKPLIKVGHKLANYKRSSVQARDAVKLVVHDSPVTNTSRVDTHLAYNAVEGSQEVDAPSRQRISISRNIRRAS